MTCFSRPYLTSVVIVSLLVGTASSPAAAPPPPRLAVVISIDQFRQDYLPRFEPYFGEGGFRMLLENGASFENCHYRHAVTKTAVGHATLLTGAHPMVHGIIENEWIRGDPATGRAAVEDDTEPLVGTTDESTTPGDALQRERAGRSPRQLLASTVGDQLKMRWGADAKVFGVSRKDRSAILMAGKIADGAFWENRGRMVSSRYYYEQLPDWAQAFDAAGHFEAMRGRTWNRLLDESSYNLIQGPDDADGEFSGDGLGRTFPRQITGGDNGERFLEALSNSPFSNEILAEFARTLTEAEQLGQDDVPDLLCVGFSQLDTVGHSYGPDSHEVMDSVLRLDRVLADFFAFLENQVGLANCVIVITADHGVAPLPERLLTLREDFPAGRVRMRDVDAGITAALNQKFGAPPGHEAWFMRDGGGYRVRTDTISGMHLPVESVAAVMAAQLRSRPEFAAAYTRAEMLNIEPAGDGVAAMLRRSFHAARSQDVIFAFTPYYMDRTGTGSTHGTPHPYDTHVPLLWWGEGVAPGKFTERVGVEDLAPTLAALMQLPRPAEAAGRPLF